MLKEKNYTQGNRTHYTNDLDTTPFHQTTND